MKVVIIGTGNVATILGKKIINAGHQITQVAGRSFDKANFLAAQFNSKPVYNLRYITLSADIYIVAVTDSSVSSVANQLKLKEKPVVHTAAAISKNALQTCSKNFGVLYPLQSLVKEMQALPQVPILIDANSESTKKLLIAFASDWADTVQVANDEERLKLHAAAVFVNNFTNHIYTVAEEYCRNEQLKFNILYPLIEETITRLKDNNPFNFQTGPAARNDFGTIEKHNEILAKYPEIKDLYNVLTDSIISFSSRNKTLNNNIQRK